MSVAICGIEYQTHGDIEKDVTEIFENQGFSFVGVPLSELSPDFTFQPLPFFDHDFDWSSKVIGTIPTNVNVDSSDPLIRAKSENLLKRCFKLSQYVGVNTVLMDLPGERNQNLARLCLYQLQDSGGKPIWFRIKISDKNSWQNWNTFFTMFPENQNKIAAVLELSSCLPSLRELDRWIGDVVLALSVDTSLFVPNKEDYPVLRREFQAYIKRAYRHKIQVIVTGPDCHGKGMESYQSYLSYLYKNRGQMSEYENFSQGYEELLQIPLQPLKDNLDNATYEIFEKDPIKYRQYEEAVYRALIDRNNPLPGESAVKQVVMVVGAGRGPLVRASLNASKRCNIPVKVYAVEKNECALITLRHLITDPYFADVTLIDSDMRAWNPPERADILVSELLGSFSDNELSPECLDGAQRLLKDDGVSIPCEYTSYLAPIMSRRLYNNTNKQSPDQPNENSFHMGYVVRLQNVWVFDKIKACFTFKHPNHDDPIDNSRHISLEFSGPVDSAPLDGPVPMEALLHGFAGYFDAKLYKDVMISIHPDTHSPDMFSWFPMFFPLNTPTLVKPGERIVVDFWRVVESTKIWYEWALTEPTPQAIHNNQGKTYWIGLFS